MKKLAKFLPLGLAILGTSAFADGTATIPMPTPDYTNFYAGVGVVLGVAIVVMLARRLKGFFR